MKGDAARLARWVAALPRWFVAAAPRGNRWVDVHLGWFVAAALLIGLAMRLRLANATYLELDEAYHVWLAVPGFPDLWRTAHQPTHPPLFIVLLHFWRKLSESEIWLRMIPVLSGELFAWFVYRWLGLVWNRRAGFVAAMLVIFCPAAVHLSAVVRAYTLALALTTAALYCLERALRGGGVRWMWGFAVLLWLGVLAEFPTLFFCVAVGLYVLLRWDELAFERRSRHVWIFSQLAAAGIYIHLLVTQILPLRAENQGLVGNEDSYFRGMFPSQGENLLWFLLKGSWAQFHLVMEATPAAAIAVVAFFVALVLVLRGAADGAGGGWRPGSCCWWSRFSSSGWHR